MMQFGSIQSKMRLYKPSDNSGWKLNITTKRIWAKVVIDFGPFRFVWYAKRRWNND